MFVLLVMFRSPKAQSPPPPLLSPCAVGIVGKPLMSRGASSQFHNDLTYGGGEVIEY
jgi:hypothetical protein